MTKSTITKDRVQEIINLACKTCSDGSIIYPKAHFTVDSKEIVELARMALAAMDSDPLVPKNCVTAEHRRVIEMLLNVCGAAFELADDSCQQDVDGEDCHVVPDDAFKNLSDALDEIENTLPTEDIDRPGVFLAWSAMPRAALKSLLQPQPVQEVIPECFRNAVSALESLYRNGQKQCWNERYTTDMAYASGVLNACRAAMLNGGL